MRKFSHRHYLSTDFLCLIPLGLLIACSVMPRIPTVSDERLSEFVRQQAASIIAVTEDKDNASRYSIYISDFPRKDILGLSTGKRRIYISYDLARLAAANTSNLWLLRQTLAHEIAHEIKGHASQTGTTSFNRRGAGAGVTGTDVGLSGAVRFRNYPIEKELEADLEGMKYWQKLGWDCRVWVRILEAFEQRHYAGDALHPTGERLKQAIGACPAAPHDAS